MVSTIHPMSQNTARHSRQLPPAASPKFPFNPTVVSEKQLHDDHDTCPSPLFTEISLSDSASLSSGTNDAFYLEKYNNRSATDQLVSLSSDTSSPIKRSKPALNIMTNLPGSQAQACDSNLTLEQVRAKKVGASTRPKSVVSAKAEHFHVSDSEQADRSRAYARLRTLTSDDGQRKPRFRNVSAEREYKDRQSYENGFKSSTDEIESRDNVSRAVMIGIRLPEHEAALHQGGDHSAITLETPNTPAIIIAPAEASHLFTPLQAPYAGDMHTRSVASADSISQSRNNTVPSVPALPHLPNRRTPANPLDAQGQTQAIGESQSRHKSQGWWNLALSPMLSRAGTIKSADQHDIPEVPAIPDAAVLNRARSNTNESQISPQTPRRLGLAGIRASIWSHWTTDHKLPPNQRSSTNTTFPRTSIIEEDKEKLLDDLEATRRSPSRGVPGLADEYYHACAIEQLSGQPFFECQNHSCANQWPAFRSIYDSTHPSQAPALGTTRNEEKASRIAPAAMTAISTAQPRTTLSTHQRSASTNSEELELSPNVREAEPASVLQAKSVDTRTPPILPASALNGVAVAGSTKEMNSETEPVLAHKTSSDTQPVEKARLRQQSSRYPNIAAIVPPSSSMADMPQVVSPGPISPDLQRILASRGDVPMTNMKSATQQTPAPTVIHNYYHYPFGEVPKHAGAAAAESSSQSARASSHSEFEKTLETKRSSLLSRLKEMFNKRNTHQTKVVERKQDKKTKRKHQCIVGLICVGLLAVIIASISLAMLLSPRGERTPTQTQWLNLTGYPPMPTGISTIIRPDAVLQSSQCVQPQTAWSCGVPPEQQSEITPNNPDQPNFRFEIKFRNGTVASNMTIPVISSRILGKRLTNPFADSSFDTRPAAPSQADQIFLGNTTDNNTLPFEGEDTPFYISFIPAFPINPSDLPQNATTSPNSNTSQITSRQAPSLNDLIPGPDIDDTGLAAAANLLPNAPFPTNQPIHLYNRGTPTEHFGFYIYYDRSIFLSTDVVSNTNSSNTTAAGGSSDPNTPVVISPDSSNAGTGNPVDSSGGAPRVGGGARSRCTWAQTRFLVQIFTSPSFDGSLLGPVPLVGGGGGVNSAINYTPPGSFPYPTSITLDRHGGNVNRKSVYCYGIDDQGKVRDGEDTGRFVLEQRGAGGVLVNEAPTLVAGDGSSGDGAGGGIDGGSGGCACRWQNWR